MQVCNGAAGYQDSPSNYAPETETCDGEDDDCDGTVDNGLDAIPSSNTNGLCSGNVQVCNGAAGYQDSPSNYAPETETCDGEDDDCDGFVDNGMGDVPAMNTNGLCSGNVQVCTGAGGYQDSPSNYAPETETCDGEDDDCDGTVDNGLDAIPSSNTNGLCSGNVQVCNGAAGYQDSPSNYTPEAETCDGEDDDCDGTVDNGMDAIPSMNTNGLCSGNVQVCTGAGGYQESPSNYTPETETCDGEDDDCDGFVDNGMGDVPAMNTNGLCSGNVQVCTGAGGYQDSPSNYAPETETCDGEDDDCDGTVDNGLDAIPSSNTNGLCSGNVQVCTGAGGYQDSPSNYTPETETCDGEDEDCDGTVDNDVAPSTEACTLSGGCAGTVTSTCQGGTMVPDGDCALSEAITDDCNGVDDDCDSATDEDFTPETVPCGEDACATGTGLSSCVDGVPGDTCDALWTDIPDTTCSDGTSGLNVTYIIVEDANGNAAGSIRCAQDLDAPGTPVVCDTQPGTTELVVYTELLCEGVAP